MPNISANEQQHARRISVYELKNNLVNLLLVTFCILAVPTLITSLTRIPLLGFIPAMLVQMILAMCLLLITFMRNNLSFRFRSIFIISLIMFVGIMSIWNFGLVGGGILFLIASCVLTTILFNPRTGWFTFSVAFGAVSLIMLMVLTDNLQFKVNMEVYSYAASAWASFIIAFAFLCVTLLVVLGRFNTFFFDMVENLENHVHSATTELKQANKIKSDFLASMSHEIRTPMNGVIGMLELLLNSPLNREQKHRTGIAHSSAKSLLTVINDILEFSKMDAGKLELELLDFNLQIMLESVAESLATQAQTKNLELILDTIQIKTPMVNGDVGRLRQILTNLIGNAIKFTDQGEVSIEAQLDHSTHILICKVTDSGPGIPEEKIQSLFTSFSQVDTSTTRKYGGTGLGLAITKQLCALMGGNVKVTSTVNLGSCFEFMVQLKPCLQSVAPSPDINLSELNILIVDDNAKSRDVLRNQLQEWGASVALSENAQAALDKCRSRIQTHTGTSPPTVYDLMFIDLEMPGMNGYEMAKKIKADKSLQNTKLILMTPMSEWGNSEHFSEKGFAGYFTKPATTTSLVNTLTMDEISTSTITSKQNPLHPNTLSKNARLLLVEDNKINQLVASGILKNMGFSTEIAANGIDALNQMKDSTNATPFDLIFMDCHMPEMDGYETTRNIRAGLAGDTYRTVPIIAMTANAMSGDRENCLAVGMDDYLSKPINSQQIHEKLTNWLPPG
ncbi:MAG: response regulator [Pseudomonadales bacterium]|nr:response regulator [Pseudomonadales bacterium]